MNNSTEVTNQRKCAKIGAILMWKFGIKKFKSVVITITKKIDLNGLKKALCENKTVRHFCVVHGSRFSSFICSWRKIKYAQNKDDY